MITIIENRERGYDTLLKSIFPHTGTAHVIGVTGAPGTGKSTLIYSLASKYAGADDQLGIVVVDPTSPVTGGSVLGDRIRMKRLLEEGGVFIRSMASRGYPGGIARATRDVVRVMDALGMNKILIETVGAGQADTAISDVSQTTLVVTMPQSGDTVQLMKAGILEIADVLILNKGDLDGADRMEMLLMGLAESVGSTRGWRIPVIRTIATKSEGVDELAIAVESHREYLESSGQLEDLQRRRLQREIIDSAIQLVGEYVWKRVSQREVDDLVGKIIARETDPASATELLIQKAGLLD